jgi:hypothetical protein
MSGEKVMEEGKKRKTVEADLILLGEEKARKSAVIAGFKVMGLLGLFNLAKNIGLVHEVRPLINELMTKKFRISDKVIEDCNRYQSWLLGSDQAYRLKWFGKVTKGRHESGLTEVGFPFRLNLK